MSSRTKLGFWVLAFLILVMLSAKVVHGPFSDQVLGINKRFIFKSTKLSEIVQKYLSGQSGDFGIYIEDLNDGEKYYYNADDSFPAASLYKLYLLAAVEKEIEQGSLQSEDTLSAKKADLTEKLGSVDFGYDDGEENIEYSVDEALTRVGRISDNFASLMLAEKIGWGKVQEMADLLGATDTRIKDPISTTPQDVAMFFKQLNQDQVVSAQSSQKIKELLSLNKINDRIPAKLPGSVAVVHKTGELLHLRHDAGIVSISTPRGPRSYVIVVLTNNVQYEDEAISLIADISKDVFDYMNSKQ